MVLAECIAQISFSYNGVSGCVFIKKGDARKLYPILDESIALICTHPPYANIIRYSEGFLLTRRFPFASQSSNGSSKIVLKISMIFFPCICFIVHFAPSGKTNACFIDPSKESLR